MIDESKLKQAAASIIEAVGDDPAREGLADTPRRVAEMYAELFAGIERDPADVLSVGFEEDRHDGMVALTGVPFFSMCEHHLLPFCGAADIGYVPGAKIAGASKLARALDIIARRPQLQERLTAQLADAIESCLAPQGVGVVISAEHLCMTIRGARKPGSRIVTSAMRGTFQTDAAVRREFDSVRGRAH